MIIKNKIENKHGSVDCLVLIGDEWHPHTIDDTNEYEIHESSDWKDVKPCPQSGKDAYALEQENAVILAELATLDATPRLLEEAALGDEYAINKLMELKVRKDALRAALK